jgi:multidrug resistance efflux pump
MKKSQITAISIVAAAAVLGTAVGGFRIYKSTHTLVEVCPVSSISTVPWNDSSSYATITTDLVQDVYLSQNQVIQEILVNEGDTVSIGTPLLILDNTLASLDLEMQALDIDNIDLQIQAADREIQLLESAAVSYDAPDDATSDADLSVSMKRNDGYFLASSGTLTDPDAIVERLDERTPLILKDGTENIYTVTCLPETILTPEFLYRIKGLDVDTGQQVGEPFVVFLQIPSIEKRIYLDGYNFDIPEDFYEMTLSDFIYGYNTLISDVASEDTAVTNPYDGITADTRDAQLTEKKNQRTTLTIDRKEAVLKYEKMRKEISDGTILSTVNGQVKSVGTIENGIDTNTPFISVVSQDGFYLKGTVNELERENISVGQRIVVTNMENGISAETEITSISDYPVSDNSSNYGTNPNTSNYPFTAFLSETNGFKNNQTVSIQILSDADALSDSIYIPKAYVREDNGNYFVYIADTDGRLKKQPVDIGSTLYGYYQEVKTGLTDDDLIAFPYGKNIKEGVRTTEADSPSLY